MLQEYNLNKIKMDQYEIEDFWEDFDNYTLFELRKIKHEYLIYHLRGIASYKGLSFIESKLINH